MQASPFVVRLRDLYTRMAEQQIYYRGSRRKCEPRDEGGDLSFFAPDLRYVTKVTSVVGDYDVYT
jgi:hypothetical protein